MLAALLLAPLLAAVPTPTRATAVLLTDVVSTAVARDGRVDVITASELRRALALETLRQQAGCTDTSCLAELAGAVGARWIVFGSIGALGDELVLTLQLYDSSTATIANRVVWRAADERALADRAEAEAAGLIAPAIAGAQRDKVVVLDLDVVAPTTDEEAARRAEKPGRPSLLGPVLLGSGAVALVGGAVLVGSAFIFDQQGDDVTKPQADADGAYGLRDGLFVGGLATAGVALAVGVAGAVFMGVGE
jgi:hypothetical protein